MAAFGRPTPLTDAVLLRAYAIRGMGLMDMDALHLAFAENLKATYFVTCDDIILKQQCSIKTKIINPVDLLKEPAK